MKKKGRPHIIYNKSSVLRSNNGAAFVPESETSTAGSGKLLRFLFKKWRRRKTTKNNILYSFSQYSETIYKALYKYSTDNPYY
jgi:hypothetical protein